jgi:hypothetical protein
MKKLLRLHDFILVLVDRYFKLMLLILLFLLFARTGQIGNLLPSTDNIESSLNEINQSLDNIDQSITDLKPTVSSGQRNHINYK